MDAIILTPTIISNEEKQLIDDFNGLKIAINKAPYKADYRLLIDLYYLDEILKEFPEPIISRSITPMKLMDKPRVTFMPLFIWHGSITSAIHLAILKYAKDILLIGDNSVHSDNFKNGVKDGVNYLRKYNPVNIYKYTKEGNFNLPYMSIREFINDNRNY